jgi:hypothetical protein
MSATGHVVRRPRLSGGAQLRRVYRERNPTEIQNVRTGLASLARLDSRGRLSQHGQYRS